VSEVKFFQRSLRYKRYFVLDHSARKMRIHKTNDPASEYKLYDYNDIKEVTFEKETLDEKRMIHERWSFEFILKTDKRDF
jgi:hypothetical protein